MRNILYAIWTLPGSLFWAEFFTMTPVRTIVGTMRRGPLMVRRSLRGPLEFRTMNDREMTRFLEAGPW